MTQIIESNVTKLGFLRHPETHEKFLPFTHWSGVLGLDTHIVDLVGGTLHQSTLGINGTTRTVYAPTAFTDSGFYAPITAGTAGQFLYSTAGTPAWGDLTTIIGKKTSGYVLAGNGTGDNDGNVSWRALTYSEVGLYSKNLKHSINGVTSSNVIGSIIRDTDSDLTLPAFYAPTSAGTQYDILVADSNGIPAWTTFNSAGLLKFDPNSGWSIDSNSYLLVSAGVTGVDLIIASTSSGTTAISDFTTPTSNPYINLLRTINGTTALANGFQLVGGTNVDVKATAAGVITIDVDALASVKKFTVKNSGDDVNEFDPASADSYVDISMVHSNGNETTQATNPTNKAGLKMTNGTNTYYQKISTAALINDAVDTLILDGNFS